MCFSQPKIPSVPAPVQNPTEADPAVQASLDAERRRRAAAAGLAATVRNAGGQAGLAAPATTAPKTLLGA